MRARHVSRDDLRRALLVNALASPVNVLVPTGVLIAGVLIGASWLAAVAVVCWLALAAHTFFDERTAKRVGARVHASRRRAPSVSPGAFNPLIGARVKAAVKAREAIHAAIEASPVALLDVRSEVDDLVEAIEGDAVRAQRINEFLAGQEAAPALERRIAQEPDASVRAALEAKHRALGRLRERLDRLKGQMDQVVATLQTVHAEILATEDVEERALASQVSELRAEVQLVSAGLEEAFAETRATRSSS
jgi:predicted component of type VI protein secretion system